MTKKRLIKKYPNRRLYDTTLSRYVTLEDVKKLVLEQSPFQVVDARTQDDLTNTTLLQIVMELEQQGAPIFTTAMLKQMIHFYGNNYQHNFSEFLEKSLSFFKDQTSNDFLKHFSVQQMQVWKNLQQQWEGLFKVKSP